MSRCRFCANIFPAKPTSTHTYWEKVIRVSRCRFGRINMFGGFHVLAGSSINLQPEKKVQSSGRRLECLGVPWAWIVSAGSSIKLQPEKKGTAVWPLVAMFGGFHELGLFWRVCRYVFRQVPWSNYKLQPETKGTVIWPSVGMSTTYFWLILNGGCSSGKLIVIEINTESEYNSNLQIGMALSIK